MKSIKKYNKNKQRLRQSQQIEDNESDEQRSHHLVMTTHPNSDSVSWRPSDESAVKKRTEINVCLDLTLISYLLLQQSKSLATER